MNSGSNNGNMASHHQQYQHTGPTYPAGYQPQYHHHQIPNSMHPRMQCTNGQTRGKCEVLRGPDRLGVTRVDSLVTETGSYTAAGAHLGSLVFRVVHNWLVMLCLTVESP